MTQAIKADGAPAFEDFGFPISHAIVDGDTVYVSGFLGIDPDTLEVIDGGIEAETRQSLENIDTILQAADASLDDAVKVTIYHTDMDDLLPAIEVYKEYVSEPYPARSTIGVSELPMDAAIEIDVTAVR